MAIVCVHLDDETKEQVDLFCQATGFSPSTLGRLFFTKVGLEQRLPFEVVNDPFYNDSNMKALDRARKQLSSGQTATKTLEELQAMEDE
jgi:DNA-damage-inducible protein J